MCVKCHKLLNTEVYCYAGPLGVKAIQSVILGSFLVFHIIICRTESYSVITTWLTNIPVFVHLYIQSAGWLKWGMKYLQSVIIPLHSGLDISQNFSLHRESNLLSPWCFEHLSAVSFSMLKSKVCKLSSASLQLHVPAGLVRVTLHVFQSLHIWTCGSVYPQTMWAQTWRFQKHFQEATNHITHMQNPQAHRDSLVRWRVYFRIGLYTSHTFSFLVYKPFLTSSILFISRLDAQLIICLNFQPSIEVCSDPEWPTIF